MGYWCEQFGRLVRNHRLGQDKTLRAFCRETGYDPAYVSRLERGRHKPPTGDVLKRYAEALGLAAGTEEWAELEATAHACAGEVPQTIMSDEELVRKLPVVFRTLGSKRPTEEDLERLVELLRRS